MTCIQEMNRINTNSYFYTKFQINIIMIFKSGYN